MENKKRKTTSIKINPDLWIEARKHCLERGISMGKYVEGLIIKDLGKK